MRYLILLVVLFSGCCWFCPRPTYGPECPPVVIEGVPPVVPGDPCYR